MIFTTLQIFGDPETEGAPTTVRFVPAKALGDGLAWLHGHSIFYYVLFSLHSQTRGRAWSWLSYMHQGMAPGSYNTQPYLCGFCSVCNKPVAVDSPTVQPQKLYKYNKCSTQPTNEGGPDSPEQLLTPDSDHKQIWLSILKDSTTEFCDGQITRIKRCGNRPVFSTAGSSLMRMAGKWRLLASGHPILERPRTGHTDNWLVLPVVYCTCASPDMLRTGFAIAKVSIGSD